VLEFRPGLKRQTRLEVNLFRHQRNEREHAPRKGKRYEQGGNQTHDASVNPRV
jgi:hypothetical protein